MSNLKDFVESASRIAEIIFAQQGSVLPMYHVVCPDGERLIPAPAQSSKDACVAVMRVVLREIGATRVLFIDEAWVLHDRTGKYQPDGGSQHHPDRTEEIIFVAEDATEGTVMASRKIRRDGDRATLDPLVFKDATSMSGRMVGLLPTAGRAN